MTVRGDLGAEGEDLSDHEQDLDPESVIPGTHVGLVNAMDNQLDRL